MKQSDKIEIVRNATNIKNMDKKIDHIEEQVTNHIPTAIANLRKDVNKRDREQDTKINQVMVKVAGITSTVFLAIQILFYFINK